MNPPRLIDERGEEQEKIRKSESTEKNAGGGRKRTKK
jgi:hypothetical protein